jgi:hypothetical protein
MPVQAKCSGCGKTVQADSKWAGKSAKCPNCKSAIRFPGEAPKADFDLNDFDDFLNNESRSQQRTAPPPPPPKAPPPPRPTTAPPRHDRSNQPFDFTSASPEMLKKEYKRIAIDSGDLIFFTRKELNHLPEILSRGEQVLSFSSGLMDGNTWLIALTDKRIIFIDKGFFFGYTQYTIDLDKITGIYGKAGIMFGEIGIEASSSDKKISMVQKASVMKFTNKVRDAIEARKK